MRTTRPGFTLLELLLVLALLVILAVATLPTFAGLKGNADQKAAADAVRGRIADARGMAMEYGTAYRLAVHQDGTKLRLAPDGPDFATAPTADAPTAAAKAMEIALDKATVAVAADADGEAPGADAGGWVTIATFLPAGTCREDTVLVEVKEGTFPPIRIQVRGLTGGARVLPAETNGGAKP